MDIDKKINELEDFFCKAEFPEVPIKISVCETITNIPLFLKTHFDTIKYYKEKKRIYEPYLNRLIKFGQMCGRIIEDEIILVAYERFKVMQCLDLRHEECFDFLIQKKILKKETEISSKTGKPWSQWYESLRDQASIRALTYAKHSILDVREAIDMREGNHPLVDRFIKVLAVEAFFKRIKTEEQLEEML